MIKRLLLSSLMLSVVWHPDVFSQETSGTSNPFAQAKFVPDISLVMDASYTQRNHRDETYKKFLMPGFSHVYAEHPLLDHEGMNLDKGFNFNYAEMVLASVVDPYFDLFVVCEFSEETAEIEEAYFSTRRLPLGWQIKGGKFLSHFGRLNAQHTHQWDFSDAPLIYAALFGKSNLNEKGLRVTWVAPIDTYLMLGGEISQGENNMSFGRSGFSDQSGAVNVREADGVNLGVAYAKTSFDYQNLTVLLGISHAKGMSRLNQGLEHGGPLSLAEYGRTHITGIDITLKYLFNSIRCLSFQSEYVLRHGRGDHYQADGSGAVEEQNYKSQQGGFYSQIVGRFSKRLRLGFRYDLIHSNEIQLDDRKPFHPGSLPRISTMAEYNPTEFSRLRLQYNYDQSRFAWKQNGYARKTNHEMILQINLAIGAHGAHAF